METVTVNEIPETVYSPHDFFFDNNYAVVNKRDIFYYNIPIGFDIETSNIIVKDDKGKTDFKKSYAFMYHWQICVKDRVCFGRTIEEMLFFFKEMKRKMRLGKKRRCVIYVHNLSFEWAFVRHFARQLDIDTKEFFLDKHKILTARLPEFGIEFRCSWKLSNMSLAKYVSNAQSPYLKMDGDKYNYKILRTTTTRLTNNEKAYCFCDVKGLADAIQRELDSGYNIIDIPLTSTGFVRRDTLRAYQYYDNTKRNGFCSKKWKEIFEILPDFDKSKTTYKQKLTLNKMTPEVYNQLKAVSAGGDTHANMLKSGIKQTNVFSHDRISSYPAVQMTKKFPMGTWRKVNPERETELKEYFNSEKHTIAKLYLSNVELKDGRYCPYIQSHKCEMAVKEKCDNGRVYKAEKIIYNVTELDFKIIDDMYTFDIDGWENVHQCYSDYLPLPLRAVNLFYFIGKCSLKHKDPYLYMKSKNKLNGIFGMTFTDIVHDIITYDYYTEKWVINSPALDTAIEKYYEKEGSCLRYDTGVYTTAWARWELHQAIKAVGKAYIYDDTDSVKWATKDPEEQARILLWFDTKNAELIDAAKKMGAFWNLDNGDISYMGVWENESPTGGHLYDEFVSLGAKKYAFKYIKEKGGEFGVTVAGLGKDSGAEFFGSVDAFKTGTVVPTKYSGRTVAAWKDAPPHYITVNGDKILTAGCCVMDDTTYTLGTGKDYTELLNLREYV